MNYCPAWSRSQKLIVNGGISTDNRAAGDSTGNSARDTSPASLAIASRAPQAPALPTPPTLLALDFERRAAAARPRLAAIARALGIEPDAVDDIIQDTLLMAWWRRAQLRSTERFDAWLDAICRNRCRQHLRVRIPVARGQGSPTVLSLDHLSGDDSTVAADVPDPQASDPLDELDRRDLSTLLDHALGRLPAPAREVLELRYLDELTEARAAHYLGLSVSALESRLHRARKQLRRVLSGAMRTEAAELGLLAGGADDTTNAWAETRLWCNLCGRHHLIGLFERRPDGKTWMRLRCPDCSVRYDCDIYADYGTASLDGMRSFGAALNRTMRYLVEHRINRRRGPCPKCGLESPVRVIGPDEPSNKPSDSPVRCWLECQCPTHGTCAFHSAIEPLAWFHPVARRFMDNHPRWITTPEVVADYAGQPAIRFRLVDVVGAAQLVLFADPVTLRVLATFEE